MNSITKDYVMIEDTNIRYANFSGKPTDYNQGGRRTFCVEVPSDMVEALESDGWKIRSTNPRDPDEEPVYYTECIVNYSNSAPTIWRISGNSKVKLDEELVSMLDYDDILSCDVVLRPYHWTVNGRSGTKGYLKSMHVRVMEDPFDAKYRDVPEAEEVPWDDAR